ncbi:MltA domain-containing protein [bacterium]|nr:MltA domain-containing protein [bacterium]
MFYPKFIILIISVVVLINGCSKQLTDLSNLPTHQQVSQFSSSSMVLVNKPFHLFLKGDDLSQDSLKKSINYSISYLKRIPANSIFQFGKLEYSAEEMIASFEIFLELIKSEQQYAVLIKELEKKFYLFKSVANDEDGVLFTGYYEPIFKGNLEKTDKFNVPVYELPSDLQVLELGEYRDSLKNRTIVYRMKDDRIAPYHTRKEIMEDGVLEGKSKVLAWMEDPIDLFFMQIQGSGIVQLPDGKLLRLSYNGSNGHNYSSIGKLLVDEDIMDLKDVSMESIRQYLNDHTEARDRILYHNKSYTFFNIDDDTRGPKGNINVPLTEHRSIATDASIFPKSALAYIESEIPVFEESWQAVSNSSFARFAVIQDTGGAIKGSGRVDLFWGRGKLAEKSAGRMRSVGKLYILIAKKQEISDYLTNPL